MDCADPYSAKTSSQVIYSRKTAVLATWLIRPELSGKCIGQE